MYGQVVLPNATDATGYKSYTIPQATLNQYVPCRLGFVLIPDGDEENSGVSEGDNLSFSETGNGWRTNLDSAEDDLSFFSEKRLNWDKKISPSGLLVGGNTGKILRTVMMTMMM